MQRKLTDEEAVFAMECCAKSDTFAECFENKCPCASEYGCSAARETLYPYALRIIKKQQKEIEKLKKGKEVPYNDECK